MNEEFGEKIDENVLSLTSLNIAQAIEEHDYLLVEFYTPWCGHCKRLQPEFSKTAEVLKKMGSSVKLAKVNCDQERELAESYGIKGFPTIKFFIKGEEKPYKGGRTEETILKYLKNTVE